eukprot:jgi/Undpi1/166/HiC_scaffold_1.g00163.m1
MSSDLTVIASHRWFVDGTVVGTGLSVESMFDRPGVYRCYVVAYFVENQRNSPILGGGKEEDKESWSSANPSEGFSSKELDPVEAHRHEFDITVKYIRREIRDLTDRDRETFFNAMSIMQRVPSAVGRQIYGDKYYSKDYFNRLHLYYGGARDCDHWHDGAGFVTSHIAVSLMFEQSLQSVNPSISLPYWDFTVEGMLYDWTNFRNSGVFADDWFGDAAPRNPLMTPDRGRFAFVPVMANATEYSNVYNSFGLLRAPWNSDPNPFLTRHDHVFGYVNNRKPSGCKQYRDAVRKDTWMDLTESMNAGAHGHIHELLGGAWSADWHGFFNRTEDIILPFTHIAVPLMKYLWRSGYLECQETCEMALAWEDCQCAVNDKVMLGKRPAEVLEGSGVLADGAGAFFYDKNLTLVDSLTDEQGHAHEKLPGYTVDETCDIFTEMLRVLSTPMKVGSHYEGTSTNDGTFWVLHPTFDRLWHLSRLQSVKNFDATWRDDHSCYGHNPTDIQPFHDLFLDGKGQGARDDAEDGQPANDVMPIKKYYTNEMLYELLDPSGMASTYVYDHFVWTHCEAAGIFMRGHSDDVSGGV